MGLGWRRGRRLRARAGGPSERRGVEAIGHGQEGARWGRQVRRARLKRGCPSPLPASQLWPSTRRISSCEGSPSGLGVGPRGLSRPRVARGKFWGRARLDGIRSLWAPEPWECLFAPRVSAWVVSGRCAWWLPRASTWGLQKDPRSHSRPRRAETRAPTRAGQDGRLLTPPHSTLFSFPRWPQSRAVQAETRHVHRAPVCAHNVTATGTSRFCGSVPAPSPAHARPEPC